MTSELLKVLSKNRLLIGGEVNFEMVMYVREALMLKVGEGNPDLTVHISSRGGSVMSGLDIYDLIKFYPGRTTAVVHIHAYSMGAVILQACDWRATTTNARVLIHHVNNDTITLDIAEDAAKLEKFIMGMRAAQQKVYPILVGRTGKSVDEIKTTCAKDSPMQADEALVYGLIDQIIVKETDIKAPWMEEKK